MFSGHMRSYFYDRLLIFMLISIFIIMSSRIAVHLLSNFLVLTNVIDTSDKVTAHGGKVTVHITNGQPKVYTSKQ